LDIREHPIAVLSASAINILKGENVTFNASTSRGKELVYYFDFGDGVIIDWGYDAVKTHKYTEEGGYIAKVKVKDVYGEESLWDNIEISASSSKSDGKDDASNFDGEDNTFYFNGDNSIPKFHFYYFDGEDITPNFDGEDSTPCFELILVLSAAIMILFWKRKKIK
jgi:hypothetical protein